MDNGSVRAAATLSLRSLAASLQERLGDGTTVVAASARWSDRVDPAELGGERAALGLSGIAVKTGARSALGTLWSVDDPATSALMRRFYSALLAPGTSRAAALQGAQRAMLEDFRYSHPAYWAPFQIIGNWL